MTTPTRGVGGRIGARALRIVAVAAVASLSLAGCGTSNGPALPTSAAPSAGDELTAFRDLYRELIETNTTASEGNCTEAAAKMAERLNAAGYPEDDIVQFVPDGHPKDGGLVATLHGTDPSAKPILLLAHIDVVEAKRKDWTRDPFTLVEENGYFYARGAYDDKAQAAIWVDALIRYYKEQFKPKRTIRVALTCGEEDNVGQVNGAQWLNQNRPDLVDAEFVLNEGGGGELDEADKPVYLGIEAGQKIYQDYILEVTDEGGHSSQPTPFNAIVALSRGLDRLASTPFPVQLNDTTKAYFAEQAALHPGQIGEAMRSIAANPGDAVAAATLSEIPEYNATLRTTCVSTMIDGGHAPNALPQRVTANVNCRILPDSTARATLDTIVKTISDPKISVKLADTWTQETAKPPSLTAAILDPVKSVAASIWPGVPVVPTMTTGATDAVFFGKAPVYGIDGVFQKPGDSHIHGLDERIPVKSLYDAREFLYRLTKVYANR